MKIQLSSHHFLFYLLLILSASANAQFKIFTLCNAEGRKVLQKNVMGKESLNTAFLQTGIYYYEITDNEVVLERGKVLRK